MYEALAGKSTTHVTLPLLGDKTVRLLILNYSGCMVDFPNLEEEAKILALKVIRDAKKKGLKKKEHHIQFIIFPENTSGAMARETNNAISCIFECPPVQAENEIEQAWMSYMESTWYYRGLMMAFRLFGAIPDPTQKGSLLWELDSANRAWLKAIAELDHAIYELLKVGDSLIREFAKKEGGQYPFASPLEAFLALTKETIYQEFQENSPWVSQRTWDIETPDDSFKKNYDPGPGKLKRNAHNRWIKFLKGGFAGDPVEEEYLIEIRNRGWTHYYLLALYQCRDTKPIKNLWKNYYAALSDKVLTDNDPIFWQDGAAYRRERKKVIPMPPRMLDNGGITWGFG